jgi:hypothetical protein
MTNMSAANAGLNLLRMTRTEADRLKTRGLGLSRAERRDYSLTKVIRSMIERGGRTSLDGLEREVHDEVASDFLQKPDGVFIPYEIFEAPRPRYRDLTVGTFGAGGATVATDIPDTVVPLLRNASSVERLGARFITGLSGNVAFPRQTAAATASVLGEQGQVAQTTQALDQILVAPHRISASVNYSTQLLMQSSVDIENFLREDLAAQIALKVDYLAYQGQGGGEPTGIFSTTGISSLQFGGTSTWAEVVQFETNLASVNALAQPGAKIVWATTPSVRGRWKAVAKTGVGVTSVTPVFLIDDFEYPDGSNDFRCNGYRGAATNQILNNLVYFFNARDLLVLFWGRGSDVICDPFSLATQGTVRITVNCFIDIALLHPASFCVSADAGNQ